LKGAAVAFRYDATVLVVGDFAVEGKPLSEHLREYVREVLVAGTAAEAVVLSRQHSPRLVLLDIASMGDGAVELLPKLDSNRVLVIAEAGDVAGIERYLAAGAADYLQKPFGAAMLRTRVSKGFEMRLKEFLGIVGMELKMPLTSLHGFSDLLLLKDNFESLTEQQQKFVKSIKSISEGINKVVYNLIDMMRAQNNWLYIQQNLHPLTAQLLDGLVQKHIKRLSQKHQVFTSSLDHDLPPVKVDEYRLEQVLQTLIENAHRYTHDGGHIRISAQPIEEANQRFVQVSVQDTGIGIRPYEREHVMNIVWFRSDDEYVREQPGYGANLYIARHIVEAHGGRMWFESEVAKGTTFHFTVPVAEEAPPSTDVG
jgi:signal transduction histidine kinase